MIVCSVADLGFSKGGFWFLLKFSSELVEDQKKKSQPAFVYTSKHSKFNLANSNTPNLTQLGHH